MRQVLVVDKNRKTLMPCHPARARELLKKGKARVLRRYPFTIILKERSGGETQKTQMKLDLGAKTTGIALVANFKCGLRCIWVAELAHRGFIIRDNLLKRSQIRHNRRSRKTRYRKARYLNRRVNKGWLAPSLLSRLNNIFTWYVRLSKFVPITNLSIELLRFDAQVLQNPDISGVEYQQGELIGYEVREYLLEKWERKCAYCGKSNIPLAIEHIIPKSRGGSNRISNLTLACNSCNQRKSNRTAEEFGYPNIQLKAKKSLAASAAVNSISRILFESLKKTDLPVEIGTGGRTKFNRTKQNYPKSHWIDAVCVGQSGEKVFIHPEQQVLLIQAVGRQSRLMCRPDRYGFPRTAPKQNRIIYGFQTGDMVKAVVTTGTKIGSYTGRVAVRSSGSFNITTKLATVQGIGYRHFTILHKSDGYSYEKGVQSDPLGRFWDKTEHIL